MHKRKIVIFFCFLLICPALLYSQTAQRIEDFLNSDTLNYGQIVQFVFEAAELPAASSPEAAFNYAVEQNWLPRNAAAGDTVSLRGLSFLVMNVFQMRGGIFFSLFNNPHYAYRELVYRGIIVGRSTPNMNVSGYNLLFIVNRVLAFQESNLL